MSQINKKAPVGAFLLKYLNGSLEPINRLSEVLALVPLGPLPGPALWQVLS
jgi:hypothetical protein